MLDAQLKSLLQRIQAGTAKTDPAIFARAILLLDKAIDDLNDKVDKLPANNGGKGGSGSRWGAVGETPRGPDFITA
jgi:hypothetical protein